MYYLLTDLYLLISKSVDDNRKEIKEDIKNYIEIDKILSKLEQIKHKWIKYFLFGTNCTVITRNNILKLYKNLDIKTGIAINTILDCKNRINSFAPVIDFIKNEHALEITMLDLYHIYDLLYRSKKALLILCESKYNLFGTCTELAKDIIYVDMFVKQGICVITDFLTTKSNKYKKIRDIIQKYNKLIKKWNEAYLLFENNIQSLDS